MNCPECRKKNPDDTLFCGHCGASLQGRKKSDDRKTATLSLRITELKPGDLFAQRYQIIDILGSGGMGRLYRALDKKLGEEVALKLLSPEIEADTETIERFSDELKLSRKIAHRHVCKMYDLNEHNGTHYITMEYIPGENLASVLKMSKQLTAESAVHIARQISEGLAEAHRLGVIHRDLKSSNIMIDREGNARILDFGIARSLLKKGRTEKGALIGTPEYMSPEQADGKPAEKRSDIYSLGVILFEMLTGRLPFTGETLLGVALKHKTEAPPRPRQFNPGLPENLERLILKCLEKDPDKRYSSAEELRSALKKVEEGLSTQIKTVDFETEAPSGKPLRLLRKGWIPVIAVPIIIAAAALIHVLTNKKPVTTPQAKQIMLVVLPFVNLGPPEDQYFTDGITDEITNRLADLHGIGVISRTSARHYKTTDKTLKEIGEELKVDYALEGTVRWNRAETGKGSVRITPQLVRVSDDTHIWAETYDRDPKDVLIVQAEIAEQVAKKLDLTILEPERRKLYTKPTENLEAYDNYLKGLEIANQAWDIQDYQKYDEAAMLFESSIQADPDFYLAHLSLMFVHLYAYGSGADRTESRLAQARQAVNKAVQLEPDAPETLAALAYFHYRGLQDYDRAEELYKAVHRARPNSLSPALGYILRRQGKWEESQALLEEAFRLNPRAADIPQQIGLSLTLLGRYEEADRWFDKSLAINPSNIQPKMGKAQLALLKEGKIEPYKQSVISSPQYIYSGYLLFEIDLFERNYQRALKRLEELPYDSFFESMFYFEKNLALAGVFYRMGDKSRMRESAERARAHIEDLIEKQPRDPRLHMALGFACAYLGLKEEAALNAEQAVDIYPVSRDAVEGPSFVLNLAQVYTASGEKEKALEQLEYLLSIPAGSYISVALLKADPIWDPLREHPRFKALTGELDISQ